MYLFLNSVFSEPLHTEPADTEQDGSVSVLSPIDTQSGSILLSSTTTIAFLPHDPNDPDAPPELATNHHTKATRPMMTTTAKIMTSAFILVPIVILTRVFVRYKGMTETVNEVLERWMWICSHRTRIIANGLIHYFLQGIRGGKIEWGDTITRFRNELGELADIAPEATSAGVVMYYLMCFISMKVHGKVINDNLLYHTALLYVDLDYILDSSSIDKTKYMTDVTTFLRRDEQSIAYGNKLEDCGNERRYRWYRTLVHHNPALIDCVLSLFFIEVESHRVQRVGVTRDELSRITYHKSRETSKLLYSILEVNDETMRETIIAAGYIAQLLDDMHDIEQDNRDGIETLATHDLRVYGNIDQLFSMTISLINDLPLTFNDLRIGFLIMLLYIASKRRVLSSKMRHVIDPYILMDARYVHLQLFST